MEDETDEKSLSLIKILRAAASANHDLVFGYVGIKQFEEFVDTFDITRSFKMPIMLVWDRNEDYHLVNYKYCLMTFRCSIDCMYG